MKVTQWWNSISYFPDWGSELRYFMEGTISATVGLLPENVKPRVVWVDNLDTAYADQEKCVIGISSGILSENPKLRLNKLASREEAMGAIMGFMVHEVGHFMFSPPLISNLVKDIPLDNHSASIANILEDIFIEKEICRFEPTFSWMILAAWDYMLTEREIAKRLAVWDGNKTQDIASITDVMICWKHRFVDFPPRSEFEAELYDMVMAVENMSKLEDRISQIAKVYNFLVEAANSVSQEKKEQQNGEGKGEESNGQGGNDGEGQESGENSKGKSTGQSQSSEEKESDSATGNLAKRKTASGVGDAPDFSKIPGTIVRNNTFSVENVAKCQVRWMKPNTVSGTSKISYNKKWLGVGALAQDRGTARVVRGQAGYSGRLTHAARLNDDGKVFSKMYVSAPNGSIGFGAPQTIVLIDFSGSMASNVRGEHDKSKFDFALEVASGMLDGFTLANHRVAVYGHTTSSNTCDVFEIKSFSDTKDTGHKRLVGSKHYVAKQANADHAAIAAVGSRFVPDGTPRRLLVISDGMPASDFYRNNSDGINMTAQEVKKLRASGCEVFSFSIDSDAVVPNNEIYGKNFNFLCEDESVVRKFVSKIV